VPRSVLISIHPRFVDLILSGEKRIEFRRVWAKEPVDQLVIYATSPAQRIVAVVAVKEVKVASVSTLWSLAKEFGGGLTRKELRNYFSGRGVGYGIKLGEVRRLIHPLDPRCHIDGFQAPQSFRYLTPKELKAVSGPGVVSLGSHASGPKGLGCT
jgi:predicted transcriptional regulator